MESSFVANDVTNELIDAHFDSGHSVRFKISTLSMAPILQPGDQILVRPISPDQIRVGDLVLIRAGTLRLVHRLIEKTLDAQSVRWITKGDNCRSVDETWSTDKIYGIIVLVEAEKGCANFRLGWVRSINFVLATCSRLEWKMRQVPQNLAKRLVSKALWICLQSSGWLVRRLMLVRFV
jgi:hypothetical protein